MKIFKILHPLLLNILKSMAVHEIHYLNQRPEIDKNAIYVANHGSKYDTIYAGLAIQKHVWILAGKQRMELADRLFVKLNGSIWIDRKSKKSKEIGTRRMLHKLMQGDNLLMYPEGTWNLAPSLPMLPMSWGVIELARKSGVPIIPLTIEYVDKDCFMNWGIPFYVNSSEDKLQKITELRDVMASLRWEVWEKLPLLHRKCMSGKEWQEEIEHRLAEYPKLDFEYEQSCVKNF